MSHPPFHSSFPDAYPDESVTSEPRELQTPLPTSPLLPSHYPSPSEPSSSFTPPVTHYQRLMHLESLIDVRALSSTSLIHNYPLQSKVFQSTVFSIYRIVQGKLYKERGCTLEEYFKTHFNISRAQVYRIVDTAYVLLDLSPMRDLPVKQRVCQTLKKVARSAMDRRTLWRRILLRMHPSKVTSKEVKETWKLLVLERARHRELMETTIQSLQRLVEIGMVLEPNIANQWVHGVLEWRFFRRECPG